jgi:hypothetical protein
MPRGGVDRRSRVRSTTCRFAAPTGLIVLLVVAISTPSAWAQSTPAQALIASPHSTEVGVYRHGEWHLRGDNGYTAQFFTYGGASDDEPVVGDWNGDGKDEVGIYRHGEWHLRGDNGVTAKFFTYGGLSNDKPIVGDWNADGLDEVGVFRDGEWHLRDNNGVS